MTAAPTYRYLNLVEAWPSFVRSGLEITDDGALRLAQLPLLAPIPETGIGLAPGLLGPMRIGVDCAGNLYVPDPATHRILRVDGCDGTVEPLACLRGPGTEPGELRRPQGVAVGRGNLLYIADTGNSRVQVIDIESGQVVGLWSDQQLLRYPADLATDRAGRVYVADLGQYSRRYDRWRYGALHRFRADGRLDRQFADTIAHQRVRLRNPVAVAIARGSGQREQLLVLEARPRRVLVYDLKGRYNRAATRLWTRALALAETPLSVAVQNDVLYVADAAHKRVLMFDTKGSFLGFANRAPTDVAGVAFDCAGRLLIHPGNGGPVLRGGLGRFNECGTFLAGPYEATSEPTDWQRLRLELDPLPEGTHVQLLTLTSTTLDGRAGRIPDKPTCAVDDALDIVGADAVADAALERWRAAPWDAEDLLIHHEPGTYLWIAGVLRGDGSASPIIRQIRLDHDRPNWLRHLPAIYSRTAQASTFMERTLALFEAALEEEDDLIDSLAAQFDAFAADDAWLEWLASWVEADALEEWPAAKRRSSIAAAFQAHASRATRAGIARVIELHTGARPLIEEVGVYATPWRLGHTGTLGLATGLSAVAAQGAVAGSTAVTDASHLIDVEDIGAPVFEPAAHHFHVSVYAAQLRGADALPRLRELLDREKPAHTTYDLCLIDAHMTVGYQARLGVDAIVAGPPSAGRLSQSFELGRRSFTDGSRISTNPRLGIGAQVGVHATLA